MKLEGHVELGHYLVKRYLSSIAPMGRRAFLLGCQIPDRNPATYLKGSLRFNWLRGHNFENAEKFMHTLCSRLEKRHRLNAADYYSLGKLIHYIADSFTFCHNLNFKGTLSEHREYETKLQAIFPSYLSEGIRDALIWKNSAIGTILYHHRDYMILSPDIHIDAGYTVSVCCAVMELLTQKSGSETIGQS